MGVQASNLDRARPPGQQRGETGSSRVKCLRKVSKEREDGQPRQCLRHEEEAIDGSRQHVLVWIHPEDHVEQHQMGGHVEQ